MNTLHQWLRGIDWAGIGAWLKRAADPSVLPIAVAVALVLAALAVSFLAIVRASRMDCALRAQNQELAKEFDGALEQMRSRIDAFADQLEETRRGIAQVPASPRIGFNLSKRSEALRMHRRGEPPDRIATTLSISPQEVDLLLKVHRIVIKNL